MCLDEKYGFLFTSLIFIFPEPFRRGNLNLRQVIKPVLFIKAQNNVRIAAYSRANLLALPYYFGKYRVLGYLGPPHTANWKIGKNVFETTFSCGTFCTKSYKFIGFIKIFDNFFTTTSRYFLFLYCVI